MLWQLCLTEASAEFTRSCWRRLEVTGSSPRVSKGVDMSTLRIRPSLNPIEPSLTVGLLTRLKKPSLTVGLLTRHNPPIIVRLSGNLLVPFDPINDQLAHFGTRAIDHGRTFVHRVSAAAVDAIVVRHHPQLLRRHQRLALELQILNTLAEWPGQIDFVSHSFGHIKIVSRNTLI